MKRIIGCFLITIVLCLFVLITADSQEDMEYVDNTIFYNPQRAPSVFIHDEHNETAGIEECNKCHHVYEDGFLVEEESSEDSYCSDCHEMEPYENLPGLRSAFHLNCKGCHLAMKKGPVLCGECHTK